jgi:hypothetical protein
MSSYYSEPLVRTLAEGGRGKYSAFHKGNDKFRFCFLLLITFLPHPSVLFIMASKVALSLFLAAAGASQYGNNHVPFRPDPSQVEAAFPDPTGVELLAPAFLQNDSIIEGFANGTEEPTSHAMMEYFISNLAERNDWMTINPAEYSSEEGRSFPFVYLSTPSTNTTSSGYSDKLRIWLQAAVRSWTYHATPRNSSNAAFLGPWQRASK